MIFLGYNFVWIASIFTGFSPCFMISSNGGVSLFLHVLLSVFLLLPGRCYKSKKDYRQLVGTLFGKINNQLVITSGFPTVNFRK